MAIIIYIALAFLYFVLGFLSISNLTIKNKALKIFIIITVLLPITKFTTAFHIHSQIDIYYFFFFGVGFIYLKKALVRRSINKSFLIGVAIVGALLLFFTLHYFVFVNETRTSINVMKDVKPLVVILLAYLFIDYFKERLATILTKKFIFRLLLLNFLISAVFLLLMYKTQFHLSLTNDPYFKYGGLRYETLGTYFGAFYLIFLVVNKMKISFTDLFLMLVPILFTGNRTLIVSIIFVLIVYYIIKASAQKVAIFASVFLLSGISFWMLVKRATEESPLARFKELVDIDYISATLLNRFSPFLNAIKSFDFLDFVVGKGFGYTFFIPWFTWRENIENYNIYLDNLYLTLYAKYGVFFIVFFFAIYTYLRTYSNRNVVPYFFLFILITSLTNAMIYQYNFLWLLLLFTFPFKTSLEKR